MHGGALTICSVLVVLIVGIYDIDMLTSCLMWDWIGIQVESTYTALEDQNRG